MDDLKRMKFLTTFFPFSLRNKLLTVSIMLRSPVIEPGEPLKLLKRNVYCALHFQKLFLETFPPFLVHFFQRVTTQFTTLLKHHFLSCGHTFSLSYVISEPF